MSSAKPPAERSRLKNVTLFNEEDELSPTPQTMPLTKIKLPKKQPRRYFDPQKISGLSRIYQATRCFRAFASAARWLFRV